MHLQPLTSEDARIGVLALQGDYHEHQLMLTRLGVASRQIRKASQLGGLVALILPGGESSTMLKFLLEESLFEPVQEAARSGCAMYGTCAGAILLATGVSSPAQASLELIDIDVERNGYGRQIDSHVSEGACPELGPEPVPMVFIRAPVVKRVGPRVDVMMQHRDAPVLLRQGRFLVSTFHPEMAEDPRIHSYFLEQVAGINR